MTKPRTARPDLPSVVVDLGNDDLRTLFPGDLIGRLHGCALQLDDPRVSEAHAMVGVRGNSLWMLGLRGSIGIGVRDQDWRHDVKLIEGSRLRLAEELELTVVSVTLPDYVLVLEGYAEPVVLDRPEWSLLDHAATPSHERQAQAWLWSQELDWLIQVPGTSPIRVEEHDTIDVAGLRLRFVRQPVTIADVPPTDTVEWRLPRLNIEIQRDITRIHVAGRPTTELTRNAHEIMSHAARLAGERGTVHWTEIAAAIWPVNGTEKNWFTAHKRLKERLQKHCLPDNLVRCRNGQVSIVLRPEDRLTVAAGTFDEP